MDQTLLTRVLALLARLRADLPDGAMVSIVRASDARQPGGPEISADELEHADRTMVGFLTILPHPKGDLVSGTVIAAELPDVIAFHEIDAHKAELLAEYAAAG